MKTTSLKENKALVGSASFKSYFCYTMRRIIIIWTYFFLATLFLLSNFRAYAQQFNTAVNNAYVITRMAEKFHFKPRLLNDEFSADIFMQLLKQLDERKIFFTAIDIQALSGFRFKLDDEIINRQSIFLTAVKKLYEDRISQADTLVDDICNSSLNFYLPEKLTITEDTSYPADAQAMRIKIYKLIKSAVLDDILEDGKIISLNPAKQKKYADSIELIARYKAKKSFKHAINIMQQSTGGIQQAIGNEYCKAIAVCYDPHTEYFPLTEKEDFESQLGKQKLAFGFSFKEEDDGKIKIKNILPGSPAFKSGQINKGDELLSVQWEDKQSIDVSSGGVKQLAEVLHMSNHDKATVKIKKQDGSERSVVLFKEEIEDEESENKVKSFLLKGNKTIGFISLPSFYQDWENESEGVKGCANDVAKEILKLKSENIQGLIIDLRYNGGGSMQEAIELSGIFIDLGPVGQYKGKDAKIFTFKDISRGTIYDGPLALMVNGYSASASEMVAGTLQDYHRAIIIGSPTYGKATAQVVLPMDTTISLEKDFSNIKSDSYFKVTISQLYRVTGNTAQAKGVLPDVLLPDVPEADLHREGENPYVLISSPLEPNKYFKPYPALAIDTLRALAQNKIIASSYFLRLKNYAALKKAGNHKKEVSLSLPDAIDEKLKAAQAFLYSASMATEKAPYTVQNNSYKEKQLQINGGLREINDQWANFLSNDPYLQIAYDVVGLMVK